MPISAYLDPHVLAFPAGNVTEVEVVEYIRELIAWAGVEGINGLALFAVRDLVSILQRDGHYPPRDRIRDVLNRLQINYVQVQDVLRVWNFIASRATPVEEISTVEEVVYQGLATSPDLDHYGRSGDYVQHMEKALVYSMLHSEVVDEKIHQAFITREVRASGDINIEATISEILSDTARFTGLPMPWVIAGSIRIATQATGIQQFVLDVAAAPTTVAEAVSQASALGAANIVIGRDVAAGIQGLDPNAGPPWKILLHLKLLSEYCAALRGGSSPGDVQRWLRDRGVDVSSESAIQANNTVFRNARTWHDGIGNSYFSLHTRPSNQTSFNRCVRIYFQIDHTSYICRVGWVGTKP